MKALKYIALFCLGFILGVSWHYVTHREIVFNLQTLEVQEENAPRNETIYKPATKYVDDYDSIYWKQTHWK